MLIGLQSRLSHKNLVLFACISLLREEFVKIEGCFELVIRVLVAVAAGLSNHHLRGALVNHFHLVHHML